MITLYSTGCPRCKVLESALEANNIIYEKVTDEDTIINKGFLSVPILEVDGNAMSFPEAFNYVKEMENGKT